MAAAKNARHGIVGLGADPVIEILQRDAGPEGILERLRAALQRPQADHLLEDDRPRPERGQQQGDHHRLDDPIGLNEQPYTDMSIGGVAAA
jgi:hypothetical protein